MKAWLVKKQIHYCVEYESYAYFIYQGKKPKHRWVKVTDKKLAKLLSPYHIDQKGVYHDWEHGCCISTYMTPDAFEKAFPHLKLKPDEIKEITISLTL